MKGSKHFFFVFLTCFFSNSWMLFEVSILNDNNSELKYGLIVIFKMIFLFFSYRWTIFYDFMPLNWNKIMPLSEFLYPFRHTCFAPCRPLFLSSPRSCARNFTALALLIGPAWQRQRQCSAQSWSSCRSLMQSSLSLCRALQRRAPIIELATRTAAALSVQHDWQQEKREKKKQTRLWATKVSKICREKG